MLMLTVSWTSDLLGKVIRLWLAYEVLVKDEKKINKTMKMKILEQVSTAISLVKQQTAGMYRFFSESEQNVLILKVSWNLKYVDERVCR